MPTSSRSPSASLALAVAFSAAGSVSSFSSQTVGLRIRGGPTTIIGSQLWNEKGTSDNSLFFAEEQGNTVGAPTTINAQFGESVPLKEKASFGESVPLKRPSSTEAEATTMSQAQAVEQPKDELKAMKQRNLIAAIAAIFFAVSSYVWQFTHPITPVQLLATMQSNSAPLTTIGSNGRPTVVDFWAPWCENCKMAAPTLQKLEDEYKDKVNFVMVNGDRPEAWPLIERFGVDAIPHVAMISAEGDVETALIGPIPKRVLEADLDALLANANGADQKTELPYKMLDVFVNAPEYRRIKFVPAAGQEPK